MGGYPSRAADCFPGDSYSVDDIDYTVTFTNTSTNAVVTAAVIKSPGATQATATITPGSWKIVVEAELIATQALYAIGTETKNIVAGQNPPITIQMKRPVTVNFDSDGGSTVTSQIVPDGGLVERPTDPNKTGYAFDGWYTSSSFSTSWVFTADTVSYPGPVTIYAKWRPEALWAKTITAGTNSASFASVVVDSSGVYAAGYQNGTGAYDYGTGNLSGTSSSQNPVLVKYDSSGTALWARTITAGTSDSTFISVAVDSSGVYVAGYQNGVGAYDYGGVSVPISGTCSSQNPILVKYDSSGNAQWARTITAGTSAAIFYSVAVDSSGVYVAGYQNGAGAYDYGTGSISGTSSSQNPVLVKYDSSGTALWVKTITAGTSQASFMSVAVDSSSVYAAGFQSSTGAYNYGGVSVPISGTSSGENPVLVKYDSLGNAQWARTITAGTSTARFISVAVDSSGVYAAGRQSGTGAYNYGTGSISGTSSGENPVLVKYDSSGTAQWARTISGGTSYAYFDSVAVDSSGYVYAAGAQNGTGAYDYGGVSISGTCSGENSVVVKYSR